MKKIIAIAALALAGVALAAPAHADDDSNFTEGAINAADNWNFTTAAVVDEVTQGQELAQVPALAPVLGNHQRG
ncbi:hypothetical protein EDD98_2964 [Streptomyces sp. PanSC19]|uniref:hypothetical protein n=1 Tax=Streptomyces sp. PanSC19 TaxID=1520455 RepID=UPI000F4A5E3E|nr:hypothetical protein [Streptomyces sp. PanSC19]ROQ33932.1 hypothetical protein EDD98_2964 [Streptomyces sp. PanSC19]